MDFRNKIKNYALKEIFSKKGGSNFRSLNSTDIQKIFEKYDEEMFKNEIINKIHKEGYDLQFKATKRRSGSGGITGFTLDPPTYYIDIAPNILETIFRSNSLGLPVAAGIDNVCTDRLGCLLLIMEHQIIHLLMIVWGYSSEGPFTPKGPEEIFGTHGKLFQCLIKRLFGHTRVDHDLGISDISAGASPVNPYFKKVSTPKAKKRVKFIAGYQNWSNSCYLDSVLIIMFYGISNFWRKIIFDNDNFEDLSEPKQDIALRLKDQLIQDYENLHDKGQTIMCSTLRNILLERVPEMKKKKRWVVYNAGAAYEAMANIIPGFLIDIPIQIMRWTGIKYIPESVKYTREAMLTFWDYLDPLTDIEQEQNYKIIRWDLIQSPVLVFTNGGAPRIKKLNQSGEEKGVMYIDGHKHKFKVKKARKFGMTIINGRYELFGVVILEGVSSKGEGGSHYTSYFKDESGQWYHYNDIGPELKSVDSPPEEGVWVEKGGEMPSMYFYRLISRVPKPDDYSSFVFLPKESPVESESSSEISKSPSKDKTKVLEGDEIEYKRIDRPDGFSIIFITDKTFMKKRLKEIKDILPLSDDVTRTLYSDDKIMWRLPKKMVKKFEKSLTKILQKSKSEKNLKKDTLTKTSKGMDSDHYINLIVKKMNEELLAAAKSDDVVIRYSKQVRKAAKEMYKAYKDDDELEELENGEADWFREYLYEHVDFDDLDKK